MRKFGWGFSALLILLSLVFLWLIKTPVISSYLTDRLGVPVSLGNISIWPHKTNIKNFKIKNPKGYKERAALQIHRTAIDYQWEKLTQNPIEIQSILLDDILLNIEFSNPLGTKNNWTAIGEKMADQKGEKEVIIRKLVLTNINVKIRGLGLSISPKVKHIDRMEFDEIDSRNGFPTKELIAKIFQGAGLQQYIQDLFDPGKVLEKFGNPLKGFGVENRKSPRIPEGSLD